MRIGEQELDIHTCQIDTFSRVLNMREGILERNVTLKLDGDRRVKIHAKRFCSMADDESGAIH